MDPKRTEEAREAVQFFCSVLIPTPGRMRLPASWAVKQGDLERPGCSCFEDENVPSALSDVLSSFPKLIKFYFDAVSISVDATYLVTFRFSSSEQHGDFWLGRRS